MATVSDKEDHKKSPLVRAAQKSGDPEHRSFRVSESVKGTVNGQVNGFMTFIREQGVVGLAVGLTLGTAVTVFVKSIVDSLVNPVIGALLPGSGELSSKFSCLSSVDGDCTNKLGWGAVISNLISFIIIAAVIYFVVKGFKLDKLDKKKE